MCCVCHIERQSGKERKHGISCALECAEQLSIFQSFPSLNGWHCCLKILNVKRFGAVIVVCMNLEMNSQKQKPFDITVQHKDTQTYEEMEEKQRERRKKQIKSTWILRHYNCTYNIHMLLGIFDIFSLEILTRFAMTVTPSSQSNCTWTWKSTKEKHNIVSFFLSSLCVPMYFSFYAVHIAIWFVSNFVIVR